MSPVQMEKVEPAFSRPGDFYNYSPCILQDGSAETRYIFYCANRTPGDVTDYLCYRQGVLKDGAWVWGEEQVALGPGKERALWDSRHVCDPDIIAGRFRYSGKEWTYALFYLGCDAESCTHNQVGVAFSNSLEGPWVKYPEPIVRYTEHPDAGIVREQDGWPVWRYWGVGQPAALSLDGNGRALLFYSRGEETGGEEMVEIDLSDMDAGPKSGPRRKLPTEGLKTSEGKPIPALMNIGVAYDPANDRLFMVREGELRAGDGSFPDFVSSFVQLAQIGGEELRAGRGIWQILGNIGPETTGWPRNHNAFLLKDGRGSVLAPDRLTLGVSMAEAFAQPPASFTWLWTYRMALLDLVVKDGKATLAEERKNR